MSTKQERTNAAVAELNNEFATSARSDKVAKIIAAIETSTMADAIFKHLIDHQLTESQWRLVDGISGLKHPSSEVTRECVRQVVIFTAERKAPKTLRDRLKKLVRR